MNNFVKTISIVVVVISLLSACSRAPQRSKETEELLIYSLLIKQACKEKTEWSLPPTFILSEEYYDSSFRDESIFRAEPSIKQETINDYHRAIVEKQILDPSLISNDPTCEFITSDKVDVLVNEDANWFNTHMLISFSRIGFDKKLSQAIVVRQYACGGECAGNDLYILVRENDLWSIKIILSGWRS